MAQTLSDTPAGLVAVLVAAHKAGDSTLEASARAELKKRFDIVVRFGNTSPISPKSQAAQ